MRTTFLRTALAAGLMLGGLIAGTGSAAAAGNITIDTYPYESGVIGTFGPERSYTYGQTFFVPAGSNGVMSSFSFKVNLPTSIIMRAFVAPWDSVNFRMLDPVYTSAPVSTSETDVMQELSFSTGSLRLQPGAPYVFGATVLLDNSTSGFGHWAVAGDSYPQGQFVWNNRGPWSEVFTTTWETYTPYDLAFRVVFGGDDDAVGPPDVVQQVGIPVSGSCDKVADADLKWGTDLTGGWTKSWAEWANGGRGGEVCTRTLTYHGGWHIAA